MKTKPLFFILLFLTISVASAYSRVIYVSQSATGDGSGSSWENACTTITAGLAASASGDEIWVKSATYRETITMEEGVALCGGFRGDEAAREERDWATNITIITATGRNTHTVVAADGATLDGLTITGGLAEQGGGIYCINSSLAVAHCMLSGNRAEIADWHYGRGGGIYQRDGRLTITDSTIIGNSAEGSGGMYVEGCSLTMTSCASSFNEGGGLWCSESPAILADCTLEGNTGHQHGLGASFIYSPVVLTRCTVASNTSTGAGGLYFDRSPATLVDCIITDNVGGICGGALFIMGEYDIEVPCETAGEEGIDCRSLYPTTLTNCLVTGNQATEFSYPAFADGLRFNNVVPTLTNCTILNHMHKGLTVYMRFYETGDYTNTFCGCNNVPILNNCIIWDSIYLPVGLGDGNFPIEPDERLEIRNSCLESGLPESGYINDDPLFVDPASGDYRLRAGSPCIDSGSNELALGIPFDVDGNARIMDGDYNGVSTVDMGAYEFHPPPPQVGSLWILHGEGAVDVLSAPTPTP